MAVKGGTLGGTGKLRPTLPGRDYHSAEVFEIEREKIFYSDWVCVGREEQLPGVGDFLQVQVADEPLLVVRNQGGGLGAFYNVCRHRGSLLCDGSAGHLGAAIRCPYHSWTYDLEGRLIHTPNVEEVDGFSRADYPLRGVHVASWEGFIFVNLAPVPRPLSECLEPWGEAYARYRMGTLRAATQARATVAANWKILVENYDECLHCPGVHPELCDLMPLYRRGLVTEDDGSPGNYLGEGVTTWTRSGTSNRPTLPGLTGEDRRNYYGFHVFPNLFVNLLPDMVATTVMFPRAPDRTDLMTYILFDPVTMARPDFHARDAVEFRELVMRQDWGVCERTQRGIASRAFGVGIYPPQDAELHAFNQRYRQALGSSAGAPVQSL